MAGLRVQERGDEEGIVPFEGLNPLPNGSLGKPLPLLSVAHHFFFFFFYLTTIVSNEHFWCLHGEIL